MKKNNGFTLVEILIVIAIMAVLTTGLGIGIGVVLGQNVKSAASDAKSVFQNAQTLAMSKNNCRVEIVAEGDVVKVVSYSSDSVVLKQEVFSKNVSVTCVIGGVARTIGSDINSVSVSYVRESGAFLPCKVDGVESGSYLEEIRFTNGTREQVMTLSIATGRVTLE